MQRLFLLLLDSQIPGHGPAKPIKDLCEAAKRLVPIYSSLTLATPMDEFQAFIDQFRNDTVASSLAFNEISTMLSKLCPQEANRPIVLKILHGLQTLQTNMQSHFVSFAKHKSSSQPQLSIPMPLLFSTSSTAADIQQAYYNVLRINLGIEDLKFLYTITENEKAYTIQWFEDILKKSTAIPSIIPIQSANQNSPFQPKSYKSHPELRPSAKKSLQPTQRSAMLNDDPFSLLEQLPTPPTLPPQLLQSLEHNDDDIAPPHERVKRNSITDFFADVTGLAPYDEVQKLQRNEEQLKAVEEETTKEVKLILSQTNAIIDSLKEQSQKLATLYKDESSVKSALATILQDESNVMAQMSKIAASLEVLTDVSTEFMVFHSTMALIPYMLQDIQECLLAITTQSFFPSLIPQEEIKRLIPIHTTASLLSISAKATMSANAAYIEIKVPEFHPAFQIIKVDTIPFYYGKDPKQFAYGRYDIPFPYVAINSQREMFPFRAADCPAKNSITICSPHAINVHIRPQTCAEELVADVKKKVICKETARPDKTPTQKFIYMNNATQIRLFSTFDDTASYLCGSKMFPNTTRIKIGYTDLAFKSDCVLYTANLKIMSPIPPTDDNDLELKTSLPDI